MVHRILDALARGRRFVTHDAWRIGRPGDQIPHGLIIKQVRVAVLLIQGFVKDALLLRAAALTFVTMLSIVPALIIFSMVLQSFKLEDKFKDFVTDLVFQKVAQREHLAAESPGAPPSASPDAQPQSAPGTETGSTVPLQDPVDWFVNQAEKGAQPHTLGVTGVLFLVATVFGLMSNIENSFNRIWGLRRRRSWYRMVTNYITLIVFLPFLVAGVLSAPAIHQIDLFGSATVWAISSTQFLIIWLAFTAMYVFVPNTRVMFRYALLGGLVAASLWILVSWGYVHYSFAAYGYDLIYQSFAQFPLLLMWIYVSWVIVLLGAELTFACQNEKTFAMERLAEGASYAYREALGLWTMLALARHFEDGRPPLSGAQAAEAWNVPTRLLNDTLRLLEDAGLVRQCATEPPAYLPARPIDRITVAHVVMALREAGKDPSSLREEQSLGSLLKELHIENTPRMAETIADLLERLPPAAPTGSEGPQSSPQSSAV